MKNKIFNERGQTLIILALAAIGLVGFVGLVIDGGNKFSDQRKAQNAADTAAMAAALAKVNALTNGDSNTPTECPPSSGTPSDVCSALLSAGYARATSNGYDGNLVTNTVEIYSPPISGPYTGLDNYVQVFITSWQDTTFSRVIGIQKTQNIVEAVGFIYEGGALANGAMIISYDPDPNCSSGEGSGGGSVDISGSGDVNLNGGGIFMNSDEVCGMVIQNCDGLNISGGAGVNSASSVDNIDQDGCSDPVPENIGQTPVVVPDEVFWPDIPAECGITPQAPDLLGTDPIDGKGEWLIHPGYYEDFPPTTLVGNKQHIFMASGVYCIDPGGPTKNFDLSWSPVDFVSLNGSTESIKNKYHAYNPDGVTLYIRKGGGFTLNANNPTYLENSTTGDYQGYLIILEGVHTSIENCAV
ncbi:MAG TPA: pilus assembly protein TadG-related protein, partial [Anaerolineales bacterium]|nr:pilus assembly protein TadG-related protein [Anaerolineales bacterium]